MENKPGWFRLSITQERIWRIDRNDPGNPIFGMPLALRLRGQFSTEALEAGFRGVLDRHEVLRSVISEESGQPGYRVRGLASWVLPILDLQSLPESRQPGTVSALVRRNAFHRFDLSRESPIRLLLLRVNLRHHILLLNVHHIVFDGWSMALMTREVEILYACALRGDPSPLHPIGIQYRDFAERQRRFLETEAYRRQLAYWVSQLSGANPLRLPLDRPRPERKSFRGGKVDSVVPSAVAVSLQKLAASRGATVFIALLTCLGCLLHRLSGQLDLCVGTPVAGRNRFDSEGTIGYFMNLVVLRLRLRAGLDFDALLKAVREVALGAYENQDLPFPLLVELLEPGQRAARTQLFQVAVNLPNIPSPVENTHAVPSFGHLAVEQMGSERCYSKWDLEFYFGQDPDGLTITLIYDADLFEPSTVKRILAEYRDILVQVVREPNRELIIGGRDARAG